MKRAIYFIVAVIFAIALPLQFAINPPSSTYIDDAVISDIGEKDFIGELNGEEKSELNGALDDDAADEGFGNGQIGAPQTPESEAAQGGQTAGDAESRPESQEEHNDDTQTAIVYTGIKVQSLVNALNVRTDPSTSSKVVGTLHAGDKVDYIEGLDGWFKIIYGDEIAYVSANTSYTRLIDTNAGSLAALIDAVIDEGLKVLGTPYEYGSQRILLWDGSLNKNFTGKTFDCSAFVQYIFYKGAGIKLQGDSRSQSLQGIQVPLNKLQKGDLIFMTSSTRLNNTGIERIGHVALYIGNNKIMHTFGTGGVRIQDYSEFWRGRAITARRVIY